MPRSAGRRTQLQNVYIFILACCTAIEIIIAITTAAAATATTTVFIIFFDVPCDASLFAYVTVALVGNVPGRAELGRSDRSPAPNSQVFMYTHNPCFHA